VTGLRRPREGELAADGFFNVCPVAAVIASQSIRGFPSLEALGDDSGRNSGSRKNGATEGYPRVDHDSAGLIRFGVACKGVKADRKASWITFDPTEVYLEEFAHSQLSMFGDVYQSAKMLNEEI